MKNTFAKELMSSSDIKGISGTKVIQGSKPGPNVGILCSTHGNEQAPLGVLPIALDLIKNELQGRLLLVMVNPEAYKANRRFLEEDMNRVFTEGGPKSDSLEASRAREVLPAFKEMDIALDLHTAPGYEGAKAFTVIPGKSEGQRQLANALDVDFNVLYPSFINGTGSTSDAFLEQGKSCITLELGAEESVDVSSQVFNILRYLVFAEAIPSVLLPEKILRNTTLDVSQMEFTKNPELLEFDEIQNKMIFDPIKEGEVLAREGDSIFKAREDCYLLFSREGEYFLNGGNKDTEPFVYLLKEEQ